ncbi:hypothetical protein ELUMI_v1c00430 [Williamsoniiplasma luminosum]|uniref:ROK family protein n=1 Tax=Williamsoniiplasma luminosum TaxID=214888 RepID=A0A2K8NSE5_9MOLU|nr:ROK family protein [Williamsoniiplasma luminosum]ATZ16772.1 hypothetical protein ELUMI_v1c00430 [Williamsoniiplasma luminosum]
MKKVCFDIGGSCIKVIVFDEKNQIILKEKIGHIGVMEVRLDGQELSEHKEKFKGVDMIKGIPLMMCLINIASYINKMDEKVKVGISVPGVVDAKKYKILTQSAIFNVDEDILGFFAKQKLVDKVWIENDGKAAAIGEMIYGQNNKITNAVVLALGSGLGGGIIINKKIYKGSHLSSGEFSKTIANINNYESSYANLSVSSLSTTAICFRYTMMTGSEKVINGHEFMQLVEQNEPTATSLFKNWMKSLANFLVNLSILDPDKILIGGGISANQTFMNALKNEVDNLDFRMLIKFNVEACKLSNDAACYGMLALIEKEYIEE